MAIQKKQQKVLFYGTRLLKRDTKVKGLESHVDEIRKSIQGQSFFCFIKTIYQDNVETLKIVAKHTNS